MKTNFLLIYEDFFLVPKILIIGPPASGRHTIGKLLQKKTNAVLIEPDDILRDAPSKIKDKLPANPNIVWEKILRRKNELMCFLFFFKE